MMDRKPSNGVEASKHRFRCNECNKKQVKYNTSYGYIYACSNKEHRSSWANKKIDEWTNDNI